MGDWEESETEVGERSGGRRQKSEASGAVYYASKPVEQKGAKSAEKSRQSGLGPLLPLRASVQRLGGGWSDDLIIR